MQQIELLVISEKNCLLLEVKRWLWSLLFISLFLSGKQKPQDFSSFTAQEIETKTDDCN